MSKSGVQKVTKAYVGIDFGTSNCGVAYANADDTIETTNDDGQQCVTIDIAKIKQVPLSEGSQGVKAPTTLALTKVAPFSVVSFGHEVLNEFDSDDHLLFHHFKMQLYDDAHRSTLTPDIGDVEVDVHVVIARCLQLFLQRFQEAYEIEHGESIAADEVKWIVTVPAIWDEAAKLQMRNAAYTADLINHPASTDLVIALEPECAAIFLNASQQVFEEGSTLAVVDCGGGTVDTTIHRVLSLPPQLDLKEIRAASGGDFGSTRIDRAALDLLADVFKYHGLGRDASKHNDKKPETWVQIPSLKGSRTNTSVFGFLNDCWEGVKKLFGNENIKTVAVDVTEFLEEVEKLHGGLGQAVDNYNKTVNGDKKIIVKDSTKIQLSEAVMNELFEKSLVPLARHVKDNIMEQVFANDDQNTDDSPEKKGVDKVILTGGFASSKKLQNVVQSQLNGSSTKLLTAYETSMATAYGAVLYGIQPRTITSRIVRVNYGLAVSKTWKEGMPERCKQTFGSRVMITNAFKMLVKEGTHMAYSQTVKKTFKPLPGMAGIEFSIYSSPVPVEYVDDDMCTKLGTIEFGGLDAALPPHRNVVKFEMFFGRTDIQVKATGPDGQTKECTIQLYVH